MKKILFTIAFISLFSTVIFTQTRTDLALRRVTEQDETSRDAQGKLIKLNAQEHLARAEVYMANRQFPEAREHWQIIVDNFYEDSTVMPKTLFGIARSYMWEREYDKAVFWFDRLAQNFPNTKDGREGLAFKGASLVRAGKNLEASETYKQYVNLYPTGE
ncbi:MAG TPA: tetratricopeptide repeat protein, partial [Pyrinomonadaceae bacterium]|nr:tetratricopeptide repeat protein [Pyrinomonadaceae bacterium]